MEELQEQTPQADFIKGFNEGYILSKYQPELANKLASALGETERAKGFQGGLKEYQDEVAKDKYPSWLTRDRAKDAETSKQKSKNDREKEKE